MADEVPYYKISALSSRWSRKEGARIVHVASLSMDKARPPLPAPHKSSAPKPPKVDPYAKTVIDIIEGFTRFKEWLDTPDPPRPARGKGEKAEMAPPFDIQEIPGAMRNEVMPIGAKLMERWFAGRLNHSPTDADEKALINQDGEPYPADMFEKKIVTLKWVPGFERAKKKYDDLISQAIRTPNALKTIREKLLFYADLPAPVAHSGGVHEPLRKSTCSHARRFCSSSTKKPQKVHLSPSHNLH
jgi:hypothetical protein